MGKDFTIRKFNQHSGWTNNTNTGYTRGHTSNSGVVRPPKSQMKCQKESPGKNQRSGSCIRPRHNGIRKTLPRRDGGMGHGVGLHTFHVWGARGVTVRTRGRREKKEKPETEPQ